MLFFLLSVALADPCADPAVEVDAAYTAFEDAEVEQARDHVDAALAARACLSEPVSAVLLEDLYGLDAVIAYALADQPRTVSALTRLRTAFPDAGPHPMFGPELTQMSETWAERVGAPSVRIVLVEGEEAWVDGRRLGVGDELRVVPGEHLIQGATAGGFVGTVDTIAQATGITLADTIWLGSPPPPGTVAAGPVRDPRGDPRVDPQPGRRRRYRGGLLATSAVALAAGGGAVGYAWSRERRFLDDPYDYASFGDCERGQECYDSARVEAIRADALNVRLLYGAGYALTAVGAGLLGAELFVLPAPKVDGAHVGLRARW